MLRSSVRSLGLASGLFPGLAAGSRLYQNAIEREQRLENHDPEDKKLLEQLEKVNIKDRSYTTCKRSDEEKPVTKIQKVPRIMLQNKNFNEQYYKPRELSIGPIHANTAKLLKKELKIKLAAKFVDKSGKTGGELLEEIKSNANRLKKCFDEHVVKSFDDDDESLCRLLFLDGCSVLQFIHSYLTDDLKDFKMSNGEAALIQHDLLLVENQIPFLVLKLLMDSCDQLTTNILRTNVLKFVLTNVPIGYSNYKNNLFYLIDEPDRVHLLDLLRAVLLFGDENVSEDRKDQNVSEDREDQNMSNDREDQNVSEDHVFRLNNTIIHRKMHRDGEIFRSTKRSFRTIQELKLAGIKLKPSASCSLKAICFTRRLFIAGQLELPSLIVDYSTEPKLMNLVAYEMCLHNYKTDCVVTSYINFLDLLIDSEEDVKDLRAAHILRNRLSSDAEVAQLFNTIGYNSLTTTSDAYLNVKNEIQKHYQRKIAVWMAQFYNEHFETPWTVIALLAAAIALGLTAIQTWYTVYPVNK